MHPALKPNNASKPADAGLNASNDSERTMPLGTGEFGDEAPLDPLAGTSTKRKFNAGSLVIVGVILAAAVGLYFMRAITRVNSAVASDTEMDKRISSFIASLTESNASSANTAGTQQVSTRPLFTNDYEVLKVLNAAYTERQVPLQNVQKDPFQLFEDTEMRPIPEATDEGPSMDTIMAAARAERRSVVEEAGSAFTLKSVMLGSNPLANLDGTIVRVGDTIQSSNEDVEFEVKSVQADGVTLSSTDPALNLTVEVTVPLESHH